MRQAVNVRRFTSAPEILAIASAAPGTLEPHDPQAATTTLYAIPPSLCSQRVRMALGEKRVAYREHVVDLMGGENLRPEYLALNRRGLVPTLVVDGQAVIDSATIMRYINNWFAGPLLAPTSEVGIAAMDVWIDRSDEFPIRGFTYRALIASGTPDGWKIAMHDNILSARAAHPEHREIYDLKLADWEALVAWTATAADAAKGRDLAEGLAGDADAVLARTEFLVGDELTLADITVFILLQRLQCGCGVELWGGDLRPNLGRYVERMKRRASYDRAVLAPFRNLPVSPMSGPCWLPTTEHVARP